MHLGHSHTQTHTDSHYPVYRFTLMSLSSSPQSHYTSVLQAGQEKRHLSAEALAQVAKEGESQAGV